MIHCMQCLGSACMLSLYLYTTIFMVIFEYFPLIRINQLPVSATRWQRGCQICFATFIWRKVTKLLKTQQILKPEGNKAQIWNPHIFINVLMCVPLNLNPIKFYILNLFIEWHNHAIYWVKTAHLLNSSFSFIWFFKFHLLKEIFKWN